MSVSRINRFILSGVLLSLAAAAATLILLAVLHQDYWWRADDRTLVFGFLPVSLAYHIGISIDACILWGLACRYCWPRDMDGDSKAAADTGTRK